MKAACYIRMSTDKQENSVDSQRKILDHYARNHKITIVNYYIDEGISGRSAQKRPAFMQMIEDSGQALFDAVLVYDSSRFSRNLEESIVYKSMLKKNGVQFLSATEPTLDEDSAVITDAMLGAINEMYSRKLSKAVKRGMDYNAQQGRYQTPPPFGYKKQNGCVTVIKDEAALVRRIFELYIEIQSWHGVAVKLNDLGARKRSAAPWSSRDVKRMLLNPAYIGKLVYSGETYDGQHKAIVDKKLWDAVQVISSAKQVTRARPPQTYRHWLSGLLKCAHCGGAMGHVTDSKGSRAYRCSNHAGGKCKFSNYISVPKAEILVKKALETLAKNDAAMYEPHPQEFSVQRDLEILQGAIKKAEAKLQRFKEAYAAGVDTLEEYQANKSLYRQEIEKIQQEIDLLSGADAIENKRASQSLLNTSGLINLLFSEEFDIAKKNTALKTVIHKIELNKYTGVCAVYFYL